MKAGLDLMSRYCENPLTKEQRNQFLIERTWDWSNPLSMMGIFLIGMSCMTNGIMLLAFTSWTIFLFVAASTLVCWIGIGILWMNSRWGKEEKLLGMPGQLNYHAGEPPALMGANSLANLLLLEINRQGRPIMVFERKLIDTLIREKV